MSTALQAPGQWEVVPIKANVPSVFTFNGKLLDPKKVPARMAGYFTIYFAVNQYSGDGPGVPLVVSYINSEQKCNTRQGRVGFKYVPGQDLFHVVAAADCMPTVIYYNGLIGLPVPK